MVGQDKSFGIFSSAVIDISETKYSAGTGHQEAVSFVRRLFVEYLEQGLEEPSIEWLDSVPRFAADWIAEKLSGKFKCSGLPPKWLGEPSWRFMGETPMDFVHQFEVDGDRCGDYYFGLMTYVFFGRRECEGGGWELVMKSVQQEKSMSGTIFID